MARSLPALGSRSPFSGNITTLQWIKPGHEAETCASLGFHPGRLDRGYAILLPLGIPLPEAFQFYGTTLNSGGRLGKPLEDKEAEKNRKLVHDEIRKARKGETELQAEDRYLAMQKEALSYLTDMGPRRLAKVLPEIGHDKDMLAPDQYPMGGGGLQWEVLPPGIPCLVAVHVGADGMAQTPAFSVNLRQGGYEARARLRRYMETAC